MTLAALWHGVHVVWALVLFLIGAWVAVVLGIGLAALLVGLARLPREPAPGPTLVEDHAPPGPRRRYWQRRQ